MPKSPELKSPEAMEKIPLSPETSQEQKPLILEFAKKEGFALEEVKAGSPRAKGVKNALRAATLAAAILAASVPGLAHAEERASSNQRQTEIQQSAGEMQTLEQQIEALKQKQQKLLEKEVKEKAGKREAELNSWLRVFNVDGLTVGDARDKVRTLVEQLGIYLAKEGGGRQHLGDVHSQGPEFIKVEFINVISGVLKKHNIKFELAPEVKAEIGLKVNFQTDAQELLKSWGGNFNLEEKLLSFGKSGRNLEFDAVTVSVAILKADAEMLVISCINADGSRNIVPCINGVYGEKNIITLRAPKKEAK